MSAMADFETGYQALGSYYDEDTDAPPTENIIHVVPDSTKASWNHIENLDDFFTRVYQYHQRNGFACMVLQDMLQLVQFLFIILFSSFLLKCVDYQILFNEKNKDGHKVTIGEAIIPMEQCVAKFDPMLLLILVLALLFLLLRLLKVIYNILKYWEIRQFYTTALKITASDLPNMTWHEVQRQLLEVQKEHQMCIHKQELTQLDIYHRILRFKNYEVSMVNKSVLPLTHRLPLFGDYTFFSTSLKYNLEMILFWGPWSPFENYWHLKKDYKSYHKRKELASQLASRVLWVGLANLILCPVIFMWQILYFFFRYAEALKREPGSLGARRWSNFAKLYLRHFNELDHELNARLNRGYKPALRYMEIFTSPLMVVLAKHLAFFSGSLLAVLVILTVIDEDVLAVQHVLAIMTCLGLTITACKVFIPDEHQVWCPELLMRSILGEIHYMPDSWKGNAHTYKVRNEFAQLFQYKAVHLFEELFSPLVTPFVLCFKVRSKALDIVDFYRNFTVEVTGVGDVCSFAQMDVRRHGNPQWVTEGQTEANQYEQAEDGKTELSLMHFTLTNPEWKPPRPGSHFISNLKEQAQKDAVMLSLTPEVNPLMTSVNSLSSMNYGPYNSLFSSIIQNSTAPPRPVGSPVTPHTKSAHPRRGGVNQTEGPFGGSGSGLLASVHNSGVLSSSAGALPPGGVTGVGSIQGQSFAVERLGKPLMPQEAHLHKVDEDTLELMSAEMSFSALYMHELHHRRLNVPFYDTYEDMHARAMWEPPDRESQDQVPSSGSGAMPDIEEEQVEQNVMSQGLDSQPLIQIKQPGSSITRSS